MDEDTKELSSPESSILSRQSPLRQNEQANKEGQLLWSLYRKHVPSPDSDRDSDASEATSDGSVRWEKNFVDKWVKVKKYACLQERTAPASEGMKGISMNHELLSSCELELDKECNSDQLKSPKEIIPNLKQDATGGPERQVLPLSEDLGPHVQTSNSQLNLSDEGTPKLNEGIMGSATNSQVSSTSDSGSMKEYYMSCLHEYEDSRQKLHNVNHQFGDVNKCDISGAIEQLPECSTNCHVSSSCDSSQLKGEKQLRQDIGTEDHTFGELNLGYVSRWMKVPPGSPRHCEVSSSSCDSDSDDEHEQRRGRQNQASPQQAQQYSDLIVIGTPESEKIVESPRNCQVSSSCESDSDGSGYSNLCLRVSEDSMEDDTDHSSGKEKRNKSHETSTVESARCDGCGEVPAMTSPLSSHIKKKRNCPQPGQLASNSQMDSNNRPQQWTRDFPYRDRPARLRSQSPTDRGGRWRRSQSPEPCRKLRSRSVIPIRDTQCVTRSKRRSKSCETVRNRKKLHDSQLFKGMNSGSEAPSNRGMKRRSRSRRRRWSKSASLPGRHKTSSSSRDILQVTSSNSESLPVRTAASCTLCSDSHKPSVPASKYAHVGKSYVNQTHLSKSWNVSEEQSRMRRSLSRSRSISNKAQQASVAVSSPTKIRHSMSDIHVHSSGKEESLGGGKEHVTRQSMFLNTSKINDSSSKKRDSLKECITTRSDSVIQNTPTIFTPLVNCHELSQYQPAFVNKLSVPVSQNRGIADSSKNRQLSSKQSSFKNMCSQTLRILRSAQENAFRRSKHSHRSQEEWSTSASRHSAPVNTPRRKSHLKKLLEIQDQSTFKNTHTLLMKHSEESDLSKDKKLSDDHVVDSSCFMSGSTAKRHTKSKKNRELAGDNLLMKNFKGFPDEQVSLNSNVSLPAIASESCEYPVSIETLHQGYSTNKTRHSGSVLTHDTLLSWSKDKKVSELLSSSDSKRLLHRSSRKRKLSNEVVHSSVVNEYAAANETPHPASKGKCHSNISRTNSSLFKNASAVYDAPTSDTIMVKCSSQERICSCKQDNALPGTKTSFIKPCSVVLKKLAPSVCFKCINKNDKFVFPPFPRVASVTEVRDFCLPQDYVNTTGKKASELI